MKWVKDKGPGVYVAHQSGCATERGGRCRCTPAYRQKVWNPAAKDGKGAPVWTDTVHDRNELGALASAIKKGGAAIKERVATSGRTFASLGDEWMEGAKSGAIRKRTGRGGRYSETTLHGYELDWTGTLRPKFGPRFASEIDAVEWQGFVDSLSRQGLSYSRIANIKSVASAIYGWAAVPTRGHVPLNPLRAIEMPPKDENPRERVATGDEAKKLLAALPAADRAAWALAFYAGLRRAEIARLRWCDLDLDGYRLTVVTAKTEAGTMRRPPIAAPLRVILKAHALAQGRPNPGSKVAARSVMSGKHAERADTAWEAAGLQRLTLHEARHTYASYLMAAGYTNREIMEFMGHADLQMVTRYAKLIPQPEEANPADRLNAYLKRAEGAS